MFLGFVGKLIFFLVSFDQAYFGMNALVDIPDLVGTLELEGLPFSCISILKRHEKDNTYKLFSREPMPESLLDSLFR